MTAMSRLVDSTFAKSHIQLNTQSSLSSAEVSYASET